MTATEHSGTPFETPGAESEIIRGDVHLPAEDPGGPLPVLLVLHGFKGYKDYGFFPHLTQRLADAGLVAVRFNFSHSGIDDDPTTFGRPDLFERDSWSKQLADVQAVIGAVEEGSLPHAGRTDVSRLALLGHSRGGFVALVTGGSDPRIKAVISLAAPSSGDLSEAQTRLIREQGYVLSPSSRTGQELRIGQAFLDDLEQNPDKLDVLAAVARMTAPLMIVHGAADDSVPVACAEEIAAAYAGEPEVLILDGASHTFNCVNPFEGPSPALEDVIGAVSGFLTSRLRGE